MSFDNREFLKNGRSENKLHFTWEYKRSFSPIIHILYTLTLCTLYTLSRSV